MVMTIRTTALAGSLALGLLLTTILVAQGQQLAPTASQPAATPTLVQIDGGKVRGTEANGLIVFKGIPFAQPPVGPLRWRPPQPVKPWEGVREATAFSPDPVQLPSPWEQGR